MLNIIYKAILDKLTVGDPLGLRMVDWYMNQERSDQAGHPLHCPAVLIEFLPINWESLSGGTQHATASVRFFLLQDKFKDKRKDTPNLTTALQHLELVGQLYRTLQGFYFDDDQGNRIINPMTRANSTTDHSPGNRFVSVLTFEFELFDPSAQPSYQLVSRDSNIDVVC